MSGLLVSSIFNFRKGQHLHIYNHPMLELKHYKFESELFDFGGSDLEKAWVNLVRGTGLLGFEVEGYIIHHKLSMLLYDKHDDGSVMKII